jgi:dephospho-CoA kinase
MLRLGLTGGIASGKSTVSGMLQKMGFVVLEADLIAHQVTEPGSSAYTEMVNEFGISVIGADKKIDRPALAKIVFADVAKLKRLNSIVHPRVEERLVGEMENMQRNKNPPDAVFVEAALIYEAGLDKKLDGVVVVWCKPSQQLERLTKRGLTVEEAQRRIASQMPAEQKLQMASETIDCSGSLEGTYAQVEQLATKLRAARPTG